MENDRLRRASVMVAACSLLYYLCSLPLQSMNYIYGAMVWNLFLAVLPLLFALLCKASMGKGVLNRLFSILMAAIWLFFFPNAPYLITDFKHIVNENGASAYFSTSLSFWVKLVFIGGGVFLGTAAGMLSLYVMHRLLRKSAGRYLSAAIVGVTCLASGYAIYIGRFLRYNSWDILKPQILIEHLKRDFHLFSLEFSLLFACYTLLCYIVFFCIYHQKETKRRPS